MTCLDGATINGPVRVLSGASLYATGGKIAGPMDASGASAVVLLGTAVGGPLNVTDATGEVAVETAKVDGPVNLVNNAAPVATIVAASTAGGPLHCAGNAQQPVNNGLPNKVGGPTSGQCQGL